jgi:hypothetical protein
MPIRTASLNAARRVAAWQFMDTASVSRLSQVVDTTGGFTDTYTTVASYPCFFVHYPITPIERENTVNVMSLAFFRFQFPHDADIRPSDRLTVGTRQFEVINASTTSVSITLEVIAQELT